MRFHALPYLRLTSELRSNLSYLRRFSVRCCSQNCPSQRLRQPGWEHGRSGFFGIVSPPLGMRKAPRDCSHEAVLDSFSLIISYHNVEVGIYRQRRVFPASFRSESGRWVKPLPKELPYAICEWCFHLRSTLRRSAPRSCCGCSGSGEPCAR